MTLWAQNISPHNDQPSIFDKLEAEQKSGLNSPTHKDEADSPDNSRNKDEYKATNISPEPTDLTHEQDQPEAAK